MDIGSGWVAGEFNGSSEEDIESREEVLLDMHRDEASQSELYDRGRE